MKKAGIRQVAATIFFALFAIGKKNTVVVAILAGLVLLATRP